MKRLSKSDWKRFLAHLVEWRERYLQRRTAELAKTLADGDGTATERFWATKEAVDTEAKYLRDCLDGHTPSNADLALLQMLRGGMIDFEDLEEFSDDLKENLRSWMEPFSRGDS
ncbi:MAG: hypothetical protein Rubg2KO_17040 [Rubricoccaceae bacterium]